MKQPAPRLNGLACPKCAEQLFDTSPHIILDSYPPQKNVHCKACGYHGTDWKDPEKYDGRAPRHAPFVKLTTAQIRALDVLDENGGTAETTKKTHHKWISGRCATALERLGLVTLKGWSPVVATLTSAGRTERARAYLANGGDAEVRLHALGLMFPAPVPKPRQP